MITHHVLTDEACAHCGAILILSTFRLAFTLFRIVSCYECDAPEADEPFAE